MILTRWLALVALIGVVPLTAADTAPDATPRNPAPAAAKAKPKPVPGEAAVADALRTLKATYRADFARRKPEDHLAFAGHLLDLTPLASDGEAMRYAILHEACEQAAKAGDAEMIRRGITELAAAYTIDPVAERLRLLMQTREFVSLEAMQAVIASELEIAAQEIDGDDYALASKAAHAAEELARSGSDATALGNAKATYERSRFLGEEYAKLGELTDLLGNISDEGSSHLGAFQCFTKNDWSAGLAHLAAGSDEMLKALAAGELMLASSAAPAAEQQFALAERWWDLAQKQRGDPRDGILAHAYGWYRRSLDGVPPLVRSKAERRSEEIERLLATSIRHPLMHYPPGAAFLLSCERDTLIMQQDRLIGVLDISGHGVRGQAIGVKPVSGAFGGALAFDGHAHLDFGNPKNLQITGSLTIAMWINPTVLAERRNPLAKSYGGEGTLTLEPSGEINYYYGTGGSNAQPYSAYSMGVPLAAKTWTHIAVVRDLTSKHILWYRNGALASDNPAPYPSSAVSTLPLLIGSGYVENFIGELDEIGIWPRALSEGEIRQMVEATAAGRH